MSNEVSNPQARSPYFQTRFGQAILGDSLKVMELVEPESVDLIMTSPPFGLVRKKDYGNEDADNYLDWFRGFGAAFHRILKDSGSVVIDIGGSWNKGVPTRSLYHFELLVMLCREFGFHLAQEFYWWNPSKLPSPAEWVNIRRIRVKDAVNSVYWLSKSPWPKASNRRVLQPYSDSMQQLLKNGYKAKLRPSGWDISDNFAVNNGAAIPPNLIAVANTESNGQYQRYCKERGIKPHPARFPSDLPEFFIRMLTDEADLVLDPFGGSCVTGEVCERLRRRWICVEMVEQYIEGGKGRFSQQLETSVASLEESNQKDSAVADPSVSADVSNSYRIPRPSALWKEVPKDRLPEHGGRLRPSSKPKRKS